MLPIALLTLAALAAVAFGVAYAGHETHAWRATAIKTTSTAALALAGWAMDAPGLIVFGLAFGAVGDFALARPGVGAFLAGMVAFAVGHLAFAAAFLMLGTGGTLPLVVAVWVTMAALVLWTALWLAPRAGALVWPVRGYGVVIGLMVAAAAVSGNTLTLVGAAVFAVSDLILALRMFVMTEPGRKLVAARVLWPLYWGGQALILAASVN